MVAGNVPTKSHCVIVEMRRKDYWILLGTWSPSCESPVVRGDDIVRVDALQGCKK